MTLQTSGPISLNDIHIEVNGPVRSTVSLNDADVRGLLGKSSGASSSFSEFYGASSFTPQLIAQPNIFGYNAAISTADNTYTQSAIDIFWRRIGTDQAVISVSGYANASGNSITRYNTDGTTTTVSGTSEEYLDLAYISTTTHNYKMVDVSAQNLSGTGAFYRQTVERPPATFNATNNVSQALAVGQTVGYRQLIIRTGSTTYKREYVVAFYIGTTLQYTFKFEVHCVV